MAPLSDILEPASHITDAELLSKLRSEEVDWTVVASLKNNSELSDNVLADILGVTEKTFRSYRKEGANLKERMQELVLLLNALFHRGRDVFGEMQHFHNWLNSGNFFLDYEAPIKFLGTTSGIRFIESRLVGMEYGDNA